MKIDRPTWRIKQICPHCGQGNPSFCYCTRCGFLTLVCEETGDTFKNPRDLADGFVNICPNCGQENTTNFETADSDKIVGAGFTQQDYQ